MYQFIRIIRRDTVNLLLNPMWLLLGIMFPFLLISIVGFLTKDSYGSFFTSYDYYGVTMMLFSSLYAGTFSANSFMEEKIKQPNLRIIYSPIRNWLIPLSKILATFIFTSTVYGAAGVMAHLFFSVRFSNGNLLQVTLLFFALNFFCSCVGVLMCCVVKSEGVANQILSIVTAVLAVLSGVFFPISGFGATINKISDKMPTTRILKLVFTLIYDQKSAGLSILLLILIGLSLLMIVLCSYLFKGEDYV